MAGAALLFAGASAAMDLMGGLFGYLASKEIAATAESRGRMIRNEAEAEAQRYAEQARGFRATQKLAYLKSGVDLSGSPLDIMDHDMLTAQENISAIRASGEARALDQDFQAGNARISGRSALVNGISGGISKIGMAAYTSGKTADKGGYDRKDLNTTSTGWKPTANNPNILNLGYR